MQDKKPNSYRYAKQSMGIPLWEIGTQPWEIIHIDYAGPFLWKISRILVNAYLKWLGVHLTSVAMPTATIEKL